MSPNVNSYDSSSSPTTLDVFIQFDELRQICAANYEHYNNCTNPSEVEQRFENAFISLLKNLDEIVPLYDTIQSFAHEYDFDCDHPANGFRSFLYVVEKCVQHTTKAATYIQSNKTALSFAVKRYQYIKEIEACNLLMENLTNCLEHLITLREWTENGDLFPSSQHTAKQLLVKAHKIDQYSFYGRCLGFQFCKTMRPLLQVISTSMAGFSKSYDHDGNLLAKTTIHFYNSGKYFFDSEARARRIVNISQNAGVEFCKAFWFLAENKFMYSLPVLYGGRVRINRVFQIPPESMQIQTKSGEFIDVPLPCSHIGIASIKVRLISNKERHGMLGVGSKIQHPLAKSLIIHCHGGGFIRYV